MILVRYATLAALVIWLGTMVSQRFGDVIGRGTAVTYACGGAILVGLFVLKFMGPPPKAFVVRAAIAALMLAVSAAAVFTAPELSRQLTALNVGLGFVLLIWYVRE
jgi:hypothetical protein